MLKICLLLFSFYIPQLLFSQLLNNNEKHTEWESFKTFTTHALLYYQSCTVLDGGSTIFHLQKGSVKYDIYIKQTSLGNWQNSPRIEIIKNDKEKTTISIYDNKENISDDCTIDNFIDLFKNKQLWGTQIDIAILIDSTKKNTIQAKYLRKFLSVLNITDKNGYFDNIAAIDAAEKRQLADIKTAEVDRATRQQRANAPKKGRDLQKAITITFEEAAFGTETKVELNIDDTCEDCDGRGGKGIKTCSTCGGTGYVKEQQRSLFGAFITQRPCHTCGGEGETYTTKCSNCKGTGKKKVKKTIVVKVPAGVDTGDHLRVAGKGPAGENGGPNGDVYIEKEVEIIE